MCTLYCMDVVTCFLIKYSIQVFFLHLVVAKLLNLHLWRIGPHTIDPFLFFSTPFSIEYSSQKNTKTIRMWKWEITWRTRTAGVSGESVCVTEGDGGVHFTLYYCSGSATFWYGSRSGSGNFRKWPSRSQKKKNSSVIKLITFWRYIYIILHQ